MQLDLGGWEEDFAFKGIGDELTGGGRQFGDVFALFSRKLGEANGAQQGLPRSAS
jgi:hypothetical protein